MKRPIKKEKNFERDALNNDIFQKIPDVGACCLCIRLQKAAVVIALYSAFLGLVAQVNYTDIKYKGLCEYTPRSDCGLIGFMYFLKYFNAFQGNLVFGASLAYFVGIIIENAITATVFLYVMSVRTILIAFQCLFLVTLGNTVGNCTMRSNETVLCVTSTVLTCFCNVYMLILVKSYRSTLLVKDESNSRGMTSRKSIVLR